MKKILTILFLVLVKLSFSTTYYISNSGNDSSLGTSTLQPWATINKVNSQIFAPDDQILFQRGSTFYGSLTVKNSGTSGNPITYGAYGVGEKPVITGFTTVTGWTNEGGGIYSKVITSDGATNMVTIDDVQYALGRYPNNTFLTYESCNSNISITDNELVSSPNWTGAEAVIKKNGYNIDRCLITDHSSNTLTYTNLGGTGSATAGYGYFIQNDLRTLDQYGEWYHDINAGKFYMYFGAINPNTKVVKVATINRIISNTSGYDYIIIDGISVNGSIATTIDFYTNTDHCVIRNCKIDFSGLDGIRLTGSYGLVDNNEVKNTNVGGIAIGGNLMINNTVTNNKITNCNMLDGQKKKNVVGFSFPTGILAAYGGCLIQYNRIENVGYNRMHVGGNNQTIKNNVIINTVLRLNDGGAIYTNGLSSGHSSFIVESNIIKNSAGNIIGTPLTSINTEGIYLDELCNGVIVQHNTILECSNCAIKLHKAHDNTIQNNICYDNRVGVGLYNYTTESTLYNNVFLWNICVSKSNQYPLQYRSSSNEAATLGTFNNNYYSRPTSESTPIYAYQPSLGTYQNYSLLQWKTFSSQDANSLGSPITLSSDDDIYFYYNPTKNDSTVVLIQPGFDVTGKAYSSPITLSPYTSIVILKDSSTGNYYYVSSSTGNDSNSGTKSLPWKTLNKVNTAALAAKDRVLFKSGDSWTGQLIPQSGSALGDIAYSSYGTGNKPLITQSVSLNLVSNWVNVSGNIWRNVDYTISSTELTTNMTDAASYSDALAPAAANKSVDATTYYSGTNSLKMTCNANQGSAGAMYWRTNTGIPMVAGTWYEFSMYIKGSAESSLNSVFVTDGSGNTIGAEIYGTKSITTDWVQYKWTFSPTTSTTGGRIYVQFGTGLTAGNSLWFDDIQYREITSYYAGTEVGNVILNNSAAGVRKWDLASCTAQGNWFWDSTNRILEIYSYANPASVYNDIKLCNALVIVDNANKSYITIDGLSIKYGGTSGVGYGSNSHHQTIKNCDVAWCGGKQWGVTTTRLGNGIDFYDNSHDNLVENCRIWEIYDAGVSNQGGTNGTIQSNITYQNNQIWNCEYSYESFNLGTSTTANNILFENNTCYNAGGGWSHNQRTDPSGFHVWLANPPTTITNFVVRNNIFDTAVSVGYYNWSNVYANYIIDYNLWNQPSGNLIRIGSTYYTQSQFANYKSVTGWDAHSLTGNPKFIGKDVGDFRLLPLSPARKVGYQGLDIGALKYTDQLKPKLLIMNRKLNAY